MQKDERISACLIVRDEEPTIVRCIESLRGVDEIVVHDTGSADRTAAIARGLGAKVVLGRGVPRSEFHFGEARQVALEQATGAWVLSVDADEVLLSGGLELLRKAARNPAYQAYEVGFLHRQNWKDKRPKRESLKRFFRKAEHRWKYRVHEQVVATGLVRQGVIPGLVLEHFPSKDREGRKEQNLELLRKACAETPEYARLHSYLARELHQRKDLAGALRSAGLYLETGVREPRFERSEGFLFQALVLRELGRGTEAAKSAWRSWLTFQDRREPLYLGAEMQMASANWKAALWWIERVLEIDPSRKPISPLTWEHVWGRIPEEAAAHCRKMLEKSLGRQEAEARREG